MIGEKCAEMVLALGCRAQGCRVANRDLERPLEMQRMDFETLVQTRKSVRGFKKQPVARAVIEEIIEVAKRAPSSMNTQPWHIHVLTGEPLERVAPAQHGGDDRRAPSRSATSSAMASIRAFTAAGRSTSPKSCSP